MDTSREKTAWYSRLVRALRHRERELAARENADCIGQGEQAERQALEKQLLSLLASIQAQARQEGLRPDDTAARPEQAESMHSHYSDHRERTNLAEKRRVREMGFFEKFFSSIPSMANLFKKPSLEELLQRRSELEEKIAAIERDSEGIDNVDNAKKAADLRRNKEQMTAQKAAMQAQVEALERSIEQANAELAKLASSGVQRILDAIGKQRWYFFHNNPKILFDKTTALVWANLQYFPYYYDDNGNVQTYSCDSAKSLIQTYNQQQWGGYGNWTIPLNTELWYLVADKSVPYHGNRDWRIKNQDYWAVVYNGEIQGKDLDDEGSTADIATRPVFVLPCSHSLVPSLDYAEHVAPENKIYSAAEKAQMTLDIFVQNHLEPIFDDEEISALYKQIYMEKPALEEELARVQGDIDRISREAVLTPDFDYTVLLSGIDTDKADKSVIPYYEAILSMTGALLDKLQDYEEEQRGVISEGNAMSLRLNAPYKDDGHLDEQENDVLRKRQAYLGRRLCLGLDVVKKQIVNVKAQGEELKERLQDIHDNGCLLDELAAIEDEARPPIAFVAENLGLMVREALRHIAFFAGHRHFVDQLVQAWDDWTQSYKAFKTRDFEALKGECETDGIEGELYERWYDDWQSVRLRIESAFLPLAAYALQDHL